MPPVPRDPLVVLPEPLEPETPWRSRARRIAVLLAVMALLSILPFTLVSGPPSNVARAQAAPVTITSTPVASPTVFDVSQLPRQLPSTTGPESTGPYDAGGRLPARHRAPGAAPSTR